MAPLTNNIGGYQVSSRTIHRFTVIDIWGVTSHVIIIKIIKEDSHNV